MPDQKIVAIQQKLRAKIFEQNPIATTSDGSDASDLLQECLKYDAELCETAFGSFGVRLHEIANDLDFEHPEIKSGKFLSCLREDTTTFNKMAQFLKLCQLAKDNNLSEISGAFSKSMTKAILPDVKNSLDFLKNPSHFVRLFKSTEERLRLRRGRQIRQIEYTTALRKIAGIWDALSSLEVYDRFGDYYDNQITQVRQRIEIYRQLRLSSLTDALMDSLEDFQASFEEQYYGFQRVPLTTAALVLGKMHNCYLEHKNGKDFVMMPSGNFDEFPFEFGPNIVYDEKGNGVHRKVDDYEYAPMVYPVYSADVPKETQEILDYLDAFPEANGKPIFDHFLAVVPGVNYPRTLSMSLCHQYLYDLEGKKRHFQDMFTTRLCLDSMLIEKKYIVPAILGERDGKCYFVCFWE